jgi:hypothetical protein
MVFGPEMGQVIIECLRILVGDELGFPELEVERLRPVEWPLRKRSS